MTQVDFSYAFAPPHRLTVALPDNSNKTLLDVNPDHLRLSWSYDNLINKPLAANVTPRTEWEVLLKPQVDGHSFSNSHWTRVEGWLPVLENIYTDGRTSLHFEVAGTDNEAIVRVEVTNLDHASHRVLLHCEKPGGWNGYNPAWVQPEWDADLLLAGWLDQADRVVIFISGGDEKPVLNPNSVCLAWNLNPGEKQVGWVIRPYRAYHPQMPAFRETNWERKLEGAKETWRLLIGQASRITLPDPAVQNAFYAGLADCFIMREQVADGSIAACPGTEIYRAASCFEPLIISILFDQVGLHATAAGNSMMCYNQQGSDGNWSDPLGWAHFMWGASGIKAWSIIEHYRLTGDQSFLSAVYPHLLASTRWQAKQRARTRVLVNNQKPLTFGLMPRGMGDCGLMGEDGSFYGIFLPHNILSVYADGITLQAAEILGQKEDISELQSIYQQGKADLLEALDRGAINEEGYRWMPGIPGETVGSRWGTLYAAFPTRLLAPDHELITGTIRKFESWLSAGGIPIHTGWMKEGMWVAITLDNLAEVLLLQDEGDKAVNYLYATLNHGTPLYSWCEERGQEPGTTETTGDRQHLWTPLAVSRFLRDALVMEDGDTLHLARGIDRQWLASGEPVGVEDMPTYFGLLSYELRYDPTTRKITGSIELKKAVPTRIVLHLRLPGGLKGQSLTAPAGVCLSAGGTLIEWQNLDHRVDFDVRMENK
jgi:hypothetical protein